MDKAELRRERRRIQNRESQRRFRERHKLRQTKDVGYCESMQSRTKKHKKLGDDAYSVGASQEPSNECRVVNTAMPGSHPSEIPAGSWDQGRQSERIEELARHMPHHLPLTTFSTSSSAESHQRTFRTAAALQPYTGKQTLSDAYHGNFTQRSGFPDQDVWLPFAQNVPQYTRAEMSDGFTHGLNPSQQHSFMDSTQCGVGLVLRQPNEMPLSPFTSVPTLHPLCRSIADL